MTTENKIVARLEKITLYVLLGGTMVTVIMFLGIMIWGTFFA